MVSHPMTDALHLRVANISSRESAHRTGSASYGPPVALVSGVKPVLNIESMQVGGHQGKSGAYTSQIDLVNVFFIAISIVVETGSLMRRRVDASQE